MPSASGHALQGRDYPGEPDACPGLCFSFSPCPGTLFQFFTLKVYGRHQKLLSESQIYEQLCQIVAGSQRKAPGVGILTTENRNVWGKAYNRLRKGGQVTPGRRSAEFAIFLPAVLPIV